MGPSTVKAVVAQHGDAARADHLQDAKRPHLFDERLDFALAAGDFDHHMLGADVDDAGPKDFGQFLDLRAAAVLGC